MSRESGKSLSASIIAGALLVPLLAVGSVVIAKPAVDVGPTSQPVETTPPTSTPSLSEDLAIACGPAGEELDSLVRSGSASSIQVAALDSLRPICEAIGIPLPEAASNPSAVTSETPPAIAPSATVLLSRSDEDADADEYELEYEFEDGEWEVDD